MKNLKKIVVLILLIIIAWSVKSFIRVAIIMEKKKVLSCTRETQTESYMANETTTFYFHKDYAYLESYMQNIVVDYGSNDIIADEYYQKYIVSCNQVKDLSGITCIPKKSNKENTVTIEFGVVIADLEDDSQQYIGDLKGKKISYDSVKKKMENFESTWSCEEK